MQIVKTALSNTFLEQFQQDIGDLISKPIFQSIYEVYDLISQAAREFLRKEQFLEFKPPLIGPVTDPGIRGAKQVEMEYYGKSYKFMSSGILYKQLLSITRKQAGRPGKIFFFADNLRLEPIETASTDRHLAEFIQIDLEIVDADHFQAMKIAEDLVTHIHSEMKKHEDLIRPIRDHFKEESMKRGLIPIEKQPRITGRFKKYTHEEIIDLIRQKIDDDPEIIQQIQKIFGTKPKEVKKDSEIPWEFEWLVSTLHDQPFFIHDYPKGARGFYDREYPDKPGILMDFDLIFPFGYGEAISGAAREYEIQKIIPRMKESGESLQKYQWYLEFLKKHGKPTAGFGIGLERTVRYFCGLPSIYFALPYPRVPGVFTP